VILGWTQRGRRVVGTCKDSRSRVHRLAFITVVATAAAALSCGYVETYLRGGPRIIDATTYMLQAKALAHGAFSWVIDDPTGHFRGRFIVARELRPGTFVVGGLFPPGYPAVLAIGVLAGAPMLVGPVLSFFIAWYTYKLTHALACRVHDSEHQGAHAEPAARAAALLSLACAALRYHTADTMAHGATALGITFALYNCLKKRPAIAGLAVGWVFATRPFSALAIATVGGVVLWRDAGSSTATSSPRRPIAPRHRAWLTFVVAMLPGVVFFAVAQHDVTGEWFTSSQKMYYALGDSPPDCFRWGFGQRIGCVFEHGDFVQAHLTQGFGVFEALGTTMRRLRMHILDIGNIEIIPIGIAILLYARRKLPSRGQSLDEQCSMQPLRTGAALVGLHIASYAPFYFDGNYPGGGARMFADILPIEHAMIGIALTRIAPARAATRSIFATIAVALFGFAVHASWDHRQLANRDGGYPMFDAAVAASQGVNRGLIFVDTDHGFNLGHEPLASSVVLPDAHNSVVVARRRHDDGDRLLVARLGNPPTYTYERFAGESGLGASSGPFALPNVRSSAYLRPWDLKPDHSSYSDAPWYVPDTRETGDRIVSQASGIEPPIHLEAEAAWPPLAQRGGMAIPMFTHACASRMQALFVAPTQGHHISASATLALPVPVTGRYRISIGVVNHPVFAYADHVISTDPRAAAQGRLTLDGESWEWKDSKNASCTYLESREALLHAPSTHVLVEATRGGVAIDAFVLTLVP